MSTPDLAAAVDAVSGPLPFIPYNDLSEQEEMRFLDLREQLSNGEFKAVLNALLECVFDLYPWFSQQDKEEMAADLWMELSGPISKAIDNRAYCQIRKERSKGAEEVAK